MGTAAPRWILHRKTTTTRQTSSARASVMLSKPLKICGVCGDHAKSFHFGGLSCDSCKAFFRRSVQNDAHKAFQCAFRGECDITMVNRKCCQYCRFHKCLDIGMETTWVMSEEERIHLLRSRMEKRRREQGQSPADGGASPTSATPPAKKCRSEEEEEEEVVVEEGDGGDVPSDPNRRWEVDEVVRLFRSRFGPNGAAPNGSHEGRSRWRLLIQFVVSVHKLVRFARAVPAFSALPVRDQISLLRANLFEMFLALHFSEHDPIGTNTSDRGDAECPFLLSSDGDVPWHDSSFRTTFRATVADVETLVLLMVVVLFCSDSADLSEDGGRAAQASQVHFCRLLAIHLRVRKGSGAWPRALLLLPTLREIRDKHVSHHFDVCDEDLAVAKRCTFDSSEKDLLLSVMSSRCERSCQPS